MPLFQRRKRLARLRMSAHANGQFIFVAPCARRSGGRVRLYAGLPVRLRVCVFPRPRLLAQQDIRLPSLPSPRLRAFWQPCVRSPGLPGRCESPVLCFSANSGSFTGNFVRAFSSCACFALADAAIRSSNVGSRCLMMCRAPPRPDQTGRRRRIG